MKIGVTKGSVESRFKDLIMNDYNIDIIKLYDKEDLKCYEAEFTILKEFQKYSYIPEERFAGYTECFKEQYENEIVEYLERTIENECL